MISSEKVSVREVRFDNVTMGEAVEFSLRYINSYVTCGGVFTPNAEIVQRCVTDEELRDIINSGALILPDGSGVIKAARILGTPLKERVAGVEFGEELIRASAGLQVPIYLLGGRPGVAESAAKRLEVKYPGTVFCGVHDGYFDRTGEENDKVIGEINSSGAVLLFVCLGFPAQEIWINNNKDKLGSVKLCLALGGSLDVYAGVVKRAPQLFIKFGLEWLYRLIRQPNRIFRMMALPKFLIGTYKEKFKRKNK